MGACVTLAVGSSGGIDHRPSVNSVSPAALPTQVKKFLGLEGYWLIHGDEFKVGASDASSPPPLAPLTHPLLPLNSLPLTHLPKPTNSTHAHTHALPQVGGEALGACKGFLEAKCNLVVDTGTSILTGPTKHINDIMDKIGSVVVVVVMVMVMVVLVLVLVVAVLVLTVMRCSGRSTRTARA